MKKSHIAGLLVIAVAIVIIISTSGDASSYETFSKAAEMYESGSKKKVHVVGTLTKDHTGNVVGIQEGADKVSFSFAMLDNEGTSERVIYNNPMPADFMRSEQVVIVGKYHGDYFLADQILLKCPSKYQEEEVKIKGVKDLDI